MKKTFLIAAAMVATLSPIAAQAQTRELARDRQDIRREQQDLREARRYGDRDDRRDARKDVREAKREYREDWQDYRRDHRQAFKGNRFNAPFKYRSFNNGARLTAGYYAPRYYVNNYKAFRLPTPGYNQRYVRHYNDVLLVNVRSGNIIRVFRNFYW